MMAHGRRARLRLREADNRREAAAADRPGAGGAVDLPGPWTPGHGLACYGSTVISPTAQG